MRYVQRLLVVVVGAVSLVGAGTVSVAAHDRGTLVQFDSMTPVTGAAVNVVNDRGITGGRLPWVIASGRGEVDRRGNVEVRVTGLVVPADGGTNPAASFRATVSCLTRHGVVNITTSAFPASSAGDATINGRVDLPDRCKDPIVFVVNGKAMPTGGYAWLAMSNAEDED
jgi:hypothetical protein